MAPFALLCQLLDAWLARQPVAPVVVEAPGEATPWPRLVTLSGVHLLPPALAPALADPAVHPRVPAELLAYLAAMHEAATLRNAALPGLWPFRTGSARGRRAIQQGGGAGRQLGWRVPAKRRRHAPASPLRRR